MNARKNLGMLGVATMFATAGSVLNAALASAGTGTTHYENVGNQGFCLDGNGKSAYLHKCGHGSGPDDKDFQLWEFSDGAHHLQLMHKASGRCRLDNVPNIVAWRYFQ